MKKYAFMVYHQEYKPFLTALQAMGVVDIIQKQEEPNEAIRQKMDISKKLDEAIKFLNLRVTSDELLPHQPKDGIQVLETVQHHQEAIEHLQVQTALLKKEQKQVAPWGNFTPDLIEKLNQAQLKVRFFLCADKKFDPAWMAQYNIERIATVQSICYFVVIQEGEEPIDLPVEEIAQPTRSIKLVKDELQSVEQQILKHQEELNEIARTDIPTLVAAKNHIDSTSDFDAALLNTISDADDKLMILEGWVPETRQTELDAYLKKQTIVYLAEEPQVEDRTPILLKNNKFSKIFEPIGNLFSMPDYQEIDLTPFFAPFFMMFFGFCLGDAGYGLVLVLIGSLLKLNKKYEAGKPMLSLVQFLGVGTIVFGLITGTFFGVGLMDYDLGVLNSIMLDNQTVFYLAMGLGLFQMLVGMGIRAANQIKQQGFAYSIPTFGWIILILAGLDIMLAKLLPTVVDQGFLIFSLALIIFFSDPKANIFARIGKGLWDIYGITGIFGDVLSYIRLFALGVSSAILGFVINDIALQIKDSAPIIGPILFVVFLIIGHVANMAISSLGSFVHPMRLTFVEFYKNAGFAGGGKKYKPFSNKI